MTDSSWALRDGLTFTRAGGEGVVYDEAGGEVHVLNESAAILWELLERGATTEEVVSRLCSEYDVAAERVRTDLVALHGDLQARGLLAAGREPAGSG